ncbi:MAG: hypothetical protein ACK2U1_11325, partial [Anaerolineales bacterium]
MNNSHVLAISVTFIIYAVLAIAFFGWGKITIRLIDTGGKENRFFTPFIWIGWAMTLFLIQLINFALPVKAVVIIPVLLVGIVFSIHEAITIYRHYINKLSKRNFLILLGNIAILVLVAGWIASRSMVTPTNYDSGLYHFNKIRWINTFS